MLFLLCCCAQMGGQQGMLQQGATEDRGENARMVRSTDEWGYHRRLDHKSAEASVALRPLMKCPTSSVSMHLTAACCRPPLWELSQSQTLSNPPWDPRAWWVLATAQTHRTALHSSNSMAGCSSRFKAAQGSSSACVAVRALPDTIWRAQRLRHRVAANSCRGHCQSRPSSCQQ